MVLTFRKGAVFRRVIFLMITGVIVGALFRPLSAWAEDSLEIKKVKKPTIEEQIPWEATSSPHDKIITLAVENDSLGGGSDRHYTSGVRLTYYDFNAQFPDFTKELAEFIPTFRINRTSSLIYSIGHNLYTPEDITSSTADPDDRPWAAFAYASIGMSSLTDNHVDDVEATIGVVGPPALGEEVQEFVHGIIDSPDPKGWDNQLETEPGLMLSWQRRWPETVNMEAGPFRVSVDPYAGITLGNIYTYMNTGVGFRFGFKDTRWEDMPLRVRPALPGNGYYELTSRGWNWQLYGGVEGRAVGRNIFLDGNTFEDGPSVDKKHFVSDANLGLALTFDQLRLSYTVVWRSEEFKGQSESDVFGAFSLGYRF